MPPKNPIFSMFGASPVRPLQRHMDEVVSCVAELVPFFKAVLAGNWEKAERIQQQITELERDADLLKKELRLQLPKGMMLAMSRRDVLEVLTTQDRIANKAKDIAGLVLGRQMGFPPAVGEQLPPFVLRAIEATLQAQKAINELDELVETGFHGRELGLVADMITELDRIEGETDAMQVAIRSALFAQERSLPPVDVMFTYRIIEWIGDLADLAQRVGSRLQLMLAR